MRLSPFFRHCETVQIFIFSEVFYCSPHQFLIFCNRMDVQKIPKGPPFYIFWHSAIYRKLQQKFEKIRKFLFSSFCFLGAFVVSSCRKSSFRVFLSLRYCADLGRSRLVSYSRYASINEHESLESRSNNGPHRGLFSKNLDDSEIQSCFCFGPILFFQTKVQLNIATLFLKMANFKTKNLANCHTENYHLQRFLRISSSFKSYCLKFLQPVLRKLKSTEIRKFLLKVEFFRYLRGSNSKYLDLNEICNFKR